jgi:hypothetical protein
MKLNLRSDQPGTLGQFKTAEAISKADGKWI